MKEQTVYQFRKALTFVKIKNEGLQDMKIIKQWLRVGVYILTLAIPNFLIFDGPSLKCFGVDLPTKTEILRSWSR